MGRTARLKVELAGRRALPRLTLAEGAAREIKELKEMDSTSEIAALPHVKPDPNASARADRPA